MSKTAAHKRYRLKATENWPKGEIVPGVTTIIDSQLGWNKRILIAWARREALAGRDPDKILERAGDIGSITHLLIEAHVKSFIKHSIIVADLSEFGKADIDKAETAFLAFLDWEKHNHLTYTDSEKIVINELLRYGGTIDILAIQDGKRWLIDPKSSKGIYPEFIVQVSAYEKASKENIDEVHLIHLGKENGEFSDHKLSRQQLDSAFEVFKHCRTLYDLQKRL